MKQKNPLSIAVLPFVSRSTNKENDLFCDGITEEIINALSKLKLLKVTSRTSSFYFKGKNLPLQDIAEQLNVTSILEGSVRLHGDKIRVTVQLINVEEDAQIWSETYDRNLNDFFEIQDEISLLIAENLREHFGHLDIEDYPKEALSQNLDAYQHCLKGKALFNKWNPESVNLAISEFEKAIAIDPNFIEAHTGLADGYSFLAVSGFAPYQEAWRKSIHHLDIAEQIDKNNPFLNYLLANKAFFTEASFEKAMGFIQKSLESKPNYSEAIQFISFLYVLKGDKKQSIKYLLFAKAIDPLNPETKFYEAYFKYRFKEYNQSIILLEELLVENPHNLPVIITLSYVLLKTHCFKKFDELVSSVPSEMIMQDERMGLNCLRFALAEDKKELDRILPELETSAKTNSSFHAHAYLYKVYCVLGRHQEAFQLLNMLFNHNSSILLLAFDDPLSESIQQHHDFNDYHEKIYALKNDNNKKQPDAPSLDNETAEKFLHQLNEYIEQELPYLNPSLTLRSLADQIKIHPSQLSLLLNEHIGKNYNTFINQLRTKHFMQLVKDPQNNHISLLGLAYESGFNSKTVFNTFFKKEMGMTPSAYVKKLK